MVFSVTDSEYYWEIWEKRGEDAKRVEGEKYRLKIKYIMWRSRPSCYLIAVFFTINNEAYTARNKFSKIPSCLISHWKALRSTPGEKGSWNHDAIIFNLPLRKKKYLEFWDFLRTQQIFLHIAHCKKTVQILYFV